MINKYLCDKLNESIDALEKPLIDAIGELVNVNSVQGTAMPGAPFGLGPRKALDVALAIADKLGFKTVNLDNKIGYAEFGDSPGLDDANYIGIFGHVDIVEAGKGWTSDPFVLRRDGDYLFGRGVLDNKGPILSNLFALYALKELGVTFKRPVRLVFGCNEESGFECVKHYNQVAKPPTFGWTPDCKWPVVVGEKGRLNLRVINHGNREVFYRWINDYVFASLSDGKALGIFRKSDRFGETLMRGYRLEMVENCESLRWSISYPETISGDEILDLVGGLLPESIALECISKHDSVNYVDADAEFVRVLADVYGEFVDVDEAIVTTSGGTYARAIDNIVAFGPSFPDQKNIAHLPDEWIKVSDLMLNTKIYAHALLALKDM
ncbi:M20/M25/M40 family metallo-hydrolase [Fundicoccus culcitae]|uniref:M20/M25/M40 family metallo-hydrolase n=1 Tax=Fundicoccus culcitae TaxID=2969821 RepID=A0ABY5P8F4_9LACT|nr:M20/M25/M40 family metallo-hydrolase [Fundicoccus culcitae]UUX35036.1 M20/M25/M40 family metallo-hydrolase [Fundicoccus culcitae]